MPTYRSEAILRDGASITIRSLTAADRDHVVSVFRRMSPTSVRRRFFTVKRERSAGDLDPVICHAPGEGCVAVDGRLRLALGLIGDTGRR